MKCSRYYAGRRLALPPIVAQARSQKFVAAHKEPRSHKGRIASVHYSDGNLYLLFFSESGKEFVLNAAFVKELKVLDEPVTIGVHEGEEPVGSENFRAGFGVWAGKDLEDIEIHILPPAAKFFGCCCSAFPASSTLDTFSHAFRFCTYALGLGRFI